MFGAVLVSSLAALIRRQGITAVRGLVQGVAWLSATMDLII